jgi:beta-1,4-mannosyl-glycoprotein beta-1,4-N-acetylglucosaminyltransferase
MIVDAFLFHREYEMLAFRMRMLYPHVDRIVIVEADKTFSGLDKPFYYEQNQSRYRWAADKIVHFKMSHAPSDDFWQTEYAQRGAIVEACKDFDDDDVLVLGDVDEIPSLDSLEWARRNAGKYPAVCLQHFFYYDLRHLRKEEWLGTVYATLRTARTQGAQELRNRRGAMTRRANGGWHLSYFGDTDAIIDKIEAFSHRELNLAEFKERTHIDACRASGEDLFKRGTKTTAASPALFPSAFRSFAPARWWGG